MAERATASEQLQRILYLLPAAARADGIRIDDLAATLETTPEQLIRDLGQVTSRAYYHRAGSGDEFQVLIDGERVRVGTPAEFQRPVRLTAREALALGLGLRVLASEAKPEDRAGLLELATRLEASLAAPFYPAAAQAPAVREVEFDDLRRMRGMPEEPAFERMVPAYTPLPREEIDLDVEDDDLRADIIDAVREHRRLQIQYIKPGDDAPRERTVSPYTLVYANGSWYIIGRDEARADVRTFRMDRILSVRVLAETFVPPESYSPASYVDEEGRLLRSPGTREAVVRYSKRIARWVQEKMPAQENADGSIDVTHKVADPHWLVRHVLQYGADAEIIAPAELRELAAAAAQGIASAA